MRPDTLSLPLTVLLLAAAFPLHAALNDTGQQLCDDGAHNMVACTAANSGDGAAYPRQDARFGRDAQATAGTLAKSGGGAAGFDFTKIANNGTSLPAGAVLGSNPTDWGCVYDHVTNLTWEVKTADGGLRDRNWTYTWYDSTAGNPGTQNGGTCLTAGRCDTEKYIADVNAAGLCGHNTGWRLPTFRELLSIVHHGTRSPAIDATYFPNTVAGWHWTADAYAPDPAVAWIVVFDDGGSFANLKGNAGRVRLVRSGQ